MSGVAGRLAYWVPLSFSPSSKVSFGGESHGARELDRLAPCSVGGYAEIRRITATSLTDWYRFGRVLVSRVDWRVSRMLLQRT